MDVVAAAGGTQVNGAYFSKSSCVNHENFYKSVWLVFRVSAQWPSRLLMGMTSFRFSSVVQMITLPAFQRYQLPQPMVYNQWNSNSGDFSWRAWVWEVQCLQMWQSQMKILWIGYCKSTVEAQILWVLLTLYRQGLYPSKIPYNHPFMRLIFQETTAACNTFSIVSQYASEFEWRGDIILRTRLNYEEKSQYQMELRAFVSQIPDCILAQFMMYSCSSTFCSTGWRKCPNSEIHHQHWEWERFSSSFPRSLDSNYSWGSCYWRRSPHCKSCGWGYKCQSTNSLLPRIQYVDSATVKSSFALNSFYIDPHFFSTDPGNYFVIDDVTGRITLIKSFAEDENIMSKGYIYVEVKVSTSPKFVLIDLFCSLLGNLPLFVGCRSDQPR